MNHDNINPGLINTSTIRANSPAELDELLRLHHAATSGPYRQTTTADAWPGLAAANDFALCYSVDLEQAGNDMAYLCAAANAAPGLAARVRALEAAAMPLYMAGRWTSNNPSIDEAQLWANLRDALGLPTGTATQLGVAHTPAPITLEREQQIPQRERFEYVRGPGFVIADRDDLLTELDRTRANYAAFVKDFRKPRAEWRNDQREAMDNLIRTEAASDDQDNALVIADALNRGEDNLVKVDVPGAGGVWLSPEDAQKDPYQLAREMGLDVGREAIVVAVTHPPQPQGSGLSEAGQLPV